jgi:UV DNA damage endonuclease
MSDDYQIRIGYACINTKLREFDVFTSRGMILKTFNDKGIDYVKKIALENIDDLLKILIFNECSGIRFFRISSSIFPQLGNPLASYNYDIEFAKDKLKIIGKFAKIFNHRLTAHPSQFVQLSSPNENVIKQSIVDLENHVKLFKTMNLNPLDGSVLIIHGGGTFGNKQAALERWEQNYLKLSTDVREYIVLENDEYGYNPIDLLPVCEKLNIPFCLDIFHNRVSKDRIPITKKLIRRIFATWYKRDMIPKIHVSEQQKGLRRGAHSKTLDRLPLYLLKLPLMFKTPLDIMLEVKDKETSVFKIYHKYFDIKMDQTGKIDHILKKQYL